MTDATAAMTPAIARLLEGSDLALEPGFKPDHIKDLGDGTYVMARRLMFHWMLVRGDLDDMLGYFDRWCYADEAGAVAAVRDFPLDPARNYEPAGWHRHPLTGRRRPDGDPAAEYIGS